MKLQITIKRKRLGKLSKKVVFSYGNACPRTTKIRQSLLKQFKRSILRNLLRSPDLEPLDYHLFSGLKKFLGGGRFATGAELQAKVTEFFSKLDCAWYAMGIEKLVYRYNKCLHGLADYVEKWCIPSENVFFLDCLCCFFLFFWKAVELLLKLLSYLQKTSQNFRNTVQNFL